MKEYLSGLNDVRQSWCLGSDLELGSSTGDQKAIDRSLGSPASSERQVDLADSEVETGAVGCYRPVC